jgi:ribokinase
MKVLTIGGAMVDTIAVIASERIERMAMRNADTAFLLLEEGRKIEAEDVSTHCGGGAVNAAVALARLGHAVQTLVVVGRDARAESILSRLSDEGVATQYVCRKGDAPTGASVIVSAHDRNAAIFTFRGANELLQVADLADDAFAVDLVYVSSLSNKSADCFPHIVAKAKAKGALVAVNPGIRQLSARQAALRDVIGQLDILTLNRHEAGALVPWLVNLGGEGGPMLEHRAGEVLPDLARRGFAAGGFELSLAGFMLALRQLGPRWTVVTDGKDGAYVGAANGITYCPAPPTEVMGTAGAGDAFASTFAACVAAAGAPDAVEKAMQAAAANAASVIGHLDTQSGLLRGDALQARIAALAAAMPLRHWPL